MLMGAPGFAAVGRAGWEEDDESEEEEEEELRRRTQARGIGKDKEEENGEEDDEDDEEAFRLFKLNRAKRRREEEEKGRREEDEEDGIGGAQKPPGGGKRRPTQIDVLNQYARGVKEREVRERLQKKKEEEERKRQQRQREHLQFEQAHTLLVPKAPPEIKLSTSVNSVRDVYREWFRSSTIGEGKPLQFYFLLAPPGGSAPSLYYIQNRHIDNGYGAAQAAWVRHRRPIFLAIAYEVSY